ncbi:uncharacterized protein A1O9_05801 [Exophiala aquamarina CBS 119918]|uniref:HpcH/HpaI aldolase/citrate lyase domain-containing protein n=1 Tax=Exophiala aquamarina CBS 119918 TaxID=1182545 RepID=A0A072PQV1_9EURO|nr:uncharacterized protein A1O9_05801 [Exophiala aquamarina CBS 119918]KEF57880.1 hypothetical protein A1O9_05801 [Exophiala aquamarina CBS 119918]
MLQNNLIRSVSQDRLCTGVGIKVVTKPEIISLAKAAGYDTVFVDLEHSVLSEKESSRLCSAALSAGITPFVRVPYQCGQGYVQRVLDGGALGVVFPHISTLEEAKQAVASTKFPPEGKRSLTAALPQFDFQRVSPTDVIQQLNQFGSTVLLLIETKESLDNIEAIASLDGIDVLLVGANDLSLELGVLGEWEHPTFQSALERIAAASHKHGKVFGMCGLYTRPDIYKRVVKDLRARYVLGHLDIGLLAMAMNSNVEMLRDVGNSLTPDM